MSPRVGVTLSGRYRLQRLIATGGMGQVWEAVDSRLGRRVAVKVLKAEYSSDPEFVERFRAEARTVAMLNHPGIAAVHDYGETDMDGEGRTAYLVMELVNGEPLNSVIKRTGRLSLRHALDMLEQTGRALQVAHAAGLVHRDVKPGNILITPTGQVKLTDFGIAKAVDAAPVTQTGMVMGTAQYIAPEQALGHDATAASDVYALGVVGYEAVSGKRPFTGDGALTVAMKHIKETPAPLPAAQACDFVRQAAEKFGRQLVVARLGSGIVALPDTCRHFQARLSLGTLVNIGGERGIQCPYHGWTFGSGGRCLRIPQLAPGRSIPNAASLPSYRAVERYGLVWINLSDDTRFPIPEFPEIDDPAFRKLRLREAEPTRTSATRMIMGTLDNTHFPWVHEGILGSRDKPEPPEHKVWRSGNELVVRYAVEQPPNIVTTDMSRQGSNGKDPVKIVYTDYVGIPNVIRLVKDSSAGRYVIWLASSPADYDSCRNFWIFARNYDLDPARDADYESISLHVRMQDKPIIESQRPWLIPPFWTQVEMPLAEAYDYAAAVMVDNMLHAESEEGIGAFVEKQNR